MSLIENTLSKQAGEEVPLLAIEGLSTHLGSETQPVRAVDDVSLRIHRGETFVLLGESGCGKVAAGSVRGRDARRAWRTHRHDFPGTDDLAQSGHDSR